jgi:hypothetical protein
MTIQWQYNDNTMTIQWQYNDNTMTIQWQYNYNIFYILYYIYNTIHYNGIHYNGIEYIVLYHLYQRFLILYCVRHPVGGLFPNKFLGKRSLENPTLKE